MDREQALEIVRKNWPDGRVQLSEALETLIPELNESEDERIRKEISKFLKDIHNDNLENRRFIADRYGDAIPDDMIPTWIAWLEKQGEQKYTQRDIDDAYLKGIADVKREVEKIDEQTKKKKKEIAEFLFNSKEYIKQKYEWIKCLGFDVKLSNEEKQDEQNFANSEKTCKDEQKPTIKDELFDHRHTQYLVESQRQRSMIQWKGDNLKEVIDFTGKDRNFDKWFKSFEEYEQYVQKHNGIFKLFNADGSHYEVPVGAWIVKTPDGCNVASKAIFKHNPTWSEEDEKMIEFWNQYYEHKVGDMPNKDVVENLVKFNSWLRTLKERYT